MSKSSSGIWPISGKIFVQLRTFCLLVSLELINCLAVLALCQCSIGSTSSSSKAKRILKYVFPFLDSLPLLFILIAQGCLSSFFYLFILLNIHCHCGYAKVPQYKTTKCSCHLCSWLLSFLIHPASIVPSQTFGVCLVHFYTSSVWLVWSAFSYLLLLLHIDSHCSIKSMVKENSIRVG